MKGYRINSSDLAQSNWFSALNTFTLNFEGEANKYGIHDIVQLGSILCSRVFSNFSSPFLFTENILKKTFELPITDSLLISINNRAFTLSGVEINLLLLKTQ